MNLKNVKFVFLIGLASQLSNASVFWRLESDIDILSFQNRDLVSGYYGRQTSSPVTELKSMMNTSRSTAVQACYKDEVWIAGAV